MLFFFYNDYKSGTKFVKITPSRKKMMNSLGRRCYKSMATEISAHKEIGSYVLTSLALQMRKEMSNICSLSHNSLLRSKQSAIKHFSWQSLLLEFTSKLQLY